MSRALLFYRLRVRTRLFVRAYWPEIVSIVFVCSAIVLMLHKLMGGA